MGYEQLDILRNYRTYKNNIVSEFYTPVLQESVLYKRAVGFFSSTALIDLSKGLAGLVCNGGKIRFIVSPLLQEDDILAMQRGYDEKAVIERSLIREFREPTSHSDEERLNWLAHLISFGRLEIKVAFTPPNKLIGMYHEKIGILYDTEGNKIAFTGSMNETINAFHNNYESIVVFNSLVPADTQRVIDLDQEFDDLWCGREKNLLIIEFPKVLKEKLLSYKKQTMDLTIDEQEILQLCQIPRENTPVIPNNVKLHNYQIDAIRKWSENCYKGIFDMATGTGKTYTGLGAAVYLFENIRRLAIIIVCPYQHLVDQWVEDVELFNLKPTIGYSASKQSDWKKRLSNDVVDFRIGVIDCFCFVTTNATFSSEFVQSELNKLGKKTLLIVDEAHNFGAYNLSKKLNPKFEYRLALSATLERHGDEAGTQLLYDYFGAKCVEYSLERAIREDKLTPYYYYPHKVFLNNDEIDRYRDLSKKIAKQCHPDNHGTVQVTEFGKKLLIERARLVAGASNKIPLLKELMEPYKSDSHILIYCGAAKAYNPNSDSADIDEEGIRQIVEVSKMLGFELKMKVTHFTSSESAAERELIKKKFSNADPYQAIVAIKCLDEGVNIPSIKTAFILASSTNPKEYVQRRGRVLRKSPNKPFAVIHDFITLPRPLERVGYFSDDSKTDISLVKKEIIRMTEFGEISKNPADADRLVKELQEVYGFDLIDEEVIYNG
ncbi:MAG: DEAD/DEAH box helicase family protein [Christensenellaceae bacterium]